MSRIGELSSSSTRYLLRCLAIGRTGKEGSGISCSDSDSSRACIAGDGGALQGSSILWYDGRRGDL